jgi:hypothetical protein
MTILARYSQQPSEVLDYDLLYGDWLTQGDALLSTVATEAPAGLSAVAIVVGTKVKIWVSGGVNGTTYKIDVTTTTVQGRIKQDEIVMKIAEV